MKHIEGGGGGEIECRLSAVVANGPECLFRYRAKRRVTRWCRVIRVFVIFRSPSQLEGNHALFDRITCFFLFILDWITEPPLSASFPVFFLWLKVRGLVAGSVLCNRWLATRSDSILIRRIGLLSLTLINVTMGCWLREIFDGDIYIYSVYQ